MAARNARAKDEESTSAYFKRIFSERPDWLKGRSNEEVLNRWLADHRGHKEVPRNIKFHLANIKSGLRKPLRSKGRKKVVGSEISSTAPSEQSLEALEILIDDCMIMASQLDRRALAHAIDHLRKARTYVVWNMGK